MGLALNNQQWLICFKTKPNQILPVSVFPSMDGLFDTGMKWQIHV